MSSVDFSVIIVNYNSDNLLKRCLESIYEFVKVVTFEIIVIDNASTDDSIKTVKNDYSQVLIVENPENTGYSHAVNCGLERANGTYCVIMNPDTELTSDIFSPVYRFFQSNTNIGAVGAIQIFSDGAAQRSFFRFPSLLGRIAYFTGINRIVNAESLKKYKAKDTGDGHIYVDVVGGAFLIVNREIMVSIGGFDPDYFLYHEEADFCYRLNKAGFQNVIIPGLKIVHHGKNDETPDNPLVYHHRNRSLLIYFYKNHTRLSLWLLLSMNIFFLALKFIFSSGQKSDGKQRRTVHLSALRYHFKFVGFLSGKYGKNIP